MPRPARPHLLVDISAHGFGHVSQTAPVVHELVQRMDRLGPGLQVTVRSAAPLELLQRRMRCEFRHIPVALDFGMKMANAVDVQVAASAAAYREYHADWDAKVARAAGDMRALRPDLLLANVPYLSLAAAHEAGIAAAAMCSLNWADIYGHYCADAAGAAQIRAQMLAAYNSARVFLRPQPAMPMPDLGNARSIGPIAQPGRNLRTQLRLPAPEGADRAGKLILAAMGGIAFRLPMERWPAIPGVRWLIPQEWNIARGDMLAVETLALPFGDVLASCDAVLTKPGYGTFTEAACAGVPVLYVTRPDWPEEPCLVRWLEQNGVCREVERERLESGGLADVLHRLWQQARRPAPAHPGAQEAAQILAEML